MTKKHTQPYMYINMIYAYQHIFIYIYIYIYLYIVAMPMAISYDSVGPGAICGTWLGGMALGRGGGDI